MRAFADYVGLTFVCGMRNDLDLYELISDV